MTLSAIRRKPPPEPAGGRFLGWNFARRAGMDYFQHFARPRHGLAIPVQNQAAVGGIIRRQSSILTTQSVTAPPPLPGFLFRPALPAGFIPTSVVTGDFNGDGRMDWVVANGGDNNLWLYLGNGDGTSQLPTIIPLGGQSPVWVAAADLRGNGKLDLVVAETDSGTIGVLLGNGDGTFGHETLYTLPAPPLCLLVGDFNGDGHPDIVAGMAGTQQTGGLAFLPGNGDGTFGAPVTSLGPPPDANVTIVDMAAADLNGDGHPDVAVLDAGLGTPIATVYLNQGNGTFGPPQEVDTSIFIAPGRSPTTLALGDLNGNGCADLVVLDTWGLADRFLGNCDGTFQTGSTYEAFGAGEVGYGIALADVNGDGHLDIVSSGFVAGVPLIFIGGQAGDLVSVLLGDGSGGFSPPRVYRGEPGMYSLAVADLTGTGHPDIVTANQDTDSASVFMNDGQGGFGQPQGGYFGYFLNGVSLGLVNAPLSLMRAADMNGDGKLDLSLLEAPSPGDGCNCDNIGVLLDQGNGVFAQVMHSDIVGATFSNIEDFALANFRNTGLPDLVTFGYQLTNGQSTLLFSPNTGNGTFGPSNSTPLPAGQGLLGVGDFNGDGKLDFVAVQGVQGSAANSSSSELTVFLGNGSGGFTPGYSAEFNVNSTLYPGNVFVGDFNGDGKLDVLVQETSTLEGTEGHDVYEFLGNGDGTFAPPRIVLTDAGPIAVGDLNHDGLPDIVEQVEPLTTPPIGLAPQYAIYLCQPDGTFNLTNTYQPYAGQVNFANVDLARPFLADFNGDGNLDILVYQTPPVGNTGGDEPENYFQILAGNGDGTFTPTYTIFDLTTLSSPQLAADVTGDGRADLIEIDGYTSSYHVIPAAPGPAMQIRLVSDPVAGSNGSVQINLALPASGSTSINLSASDPAISIPPSVTIPAGAVTQTVPFQIASAFNPYHVFSIQAQLGTETDTTYGTQATQQVGLQMSLLNTSLTVAGGQTTSDYGLEIFSTGGYSTTVQLACSGLPAGAVCQFGSNPLLVPANASAYPALTVATTASLAAGTYPFRVTATDGTISGQITATLVVVLGPAIEISPASLTFAVQAVGTTSPPQAATVTNAGGATLTVAVSVFEDSGAMDFAQTNNCNGSVPPGQSCTVEVAFAPVATGSRTASLTIDTNVPSGATRQFVNLTGTGEGAMAYVSPSSLNFPLEYVGTPSPEQTVIVSSTGTIPLTISSISVAGTNASDFVVEASGTTCSAGGTVAVGLNCAVNIAFAPTAAGIRLATLSVADSGGGSPQMVSLSGSGNGPDYSLGPAPGSAASATVTAGSTATYTVSLSPIGPFNQTVVLTCTGAVPEGTCSVAPPSATLNGTSAQNVTVTVTTTARSQVPPASPPAMPGGLPRVLWIAVLGLAIVAAVYDRRVFWRSVDRRICGPRSFPGHEPQVPQGGTVCAAALGALLLIVTLWASCGGGGGGSGGGNPGTPAGNYGLTVTGTSGTLSHSTNLTLVVQ